MKGYFVIFVVVVFSHGVSSANVCKIRQPNPRPCEYCECRDGSSSCEGCKTPCNSYEELECQHGKCIENQCSCDSCWTGQSCDMPGNYFVPQFTKDFYEFTLKPSKKRTIKSVVAMDNCQAGDHDCPCATVNYVIKGGNDAALFVINRSNGELSYHPENGFTQNEVYLTIAAFNPYDPALESSTEVALYFEGQGQGHMPQMANDIPHVTSRRLLQDQGKMDTVVPGFGRDAADQDPEAPKNRRKRAVTLPAEIQFIFKKKTLSKVTCSIGDQLPFTFEIFMPKIASKMRCELFSPRDNKTNDAIFVLSKPTTTIGKNFMIKASSVPWVLAAFKGGNLFDHAVIDLGNAQNFLNDTTVEASSKIAFAFSAVVMKEVVKDRLYYVSVGCSYQDKKKVWIGQAMYKGVVDNKSPISSTPPAFKIEGPIEATKNAPVVWKITLTIYDMYNNVNMLVEPDPAHVKMIRLNRVQVAEVGEYYAGVPVGEHNSAVNKDPVNSTLLLDLGKIVNTGFRLGNTNGTKCSIVISVSGYLMGTDDVVVGTQYGIDVAVQVNSSRVWVAEKKLKALAAVATCDKKPTFTAEISHKKLAPNGVLSVKVNVTTPPKTAINFTYHASLPYNTTTQTQMVTDEQKIRVSYIGFNNAGYGNATAPSLTSEANDGNKDYVEWGLGYIRNSGEKSGAADNTVQIQLLATLVNSSETELWVTVGIRYCSSWIWVAQLSFEVVQDIPNYVAPLLIDFLIRSPMRHAAIYSNGTYVFWIDVFIPPGSMYSPLKIDIAGPFYHKALLGLCELNVIHVGDELQGYDPMKVNATYTSTAGDGNNDRASVTLGTLSNVGKEYADMFWLSNIVRLSVGVAMTEHDPSIDYNKKNTTAYCVAFGCRYTNRSLWVGSTCLEKSTVVPDIQKGEDEPTFNQTPLKTSATAAKFGEAFGFEVTFLMPFGTSASYAVSSLTSSKVLSICRIRVKEKGSNIPCLPEVASYPKSMSYVNKTHVHVDMVQMTLGSISNVGYDLKTKKDTTMNSITFFTAGYLSPEKKDLTQGAAGTKHYHGNAVQVSDKRIWIETWPITVAPDDSSSSLETDWTATFATGTRSPGDKVVIGGTIIMYVKINIPAAQTSQFQVDVYAEDAKKGKISICDFQIVSAGFNLPCVNGSSTVLTKESDNDNETFHKASIDLGWVSNIAQTTDTDSDDNQLILEAILSVQKDFGTAAGEKIKMTAAAKYADKDTITVGDVVDVEVVDTLPDHEKDRQQIVRMYPMDYAPLVKFNNRTVWSLNISMEEMTAEYSVNIQTVAVGPGSPLIAFDRLKLIAGGNIYHCGRDEFEFKSVKKSLQNANVATTQFNLINLTTPAITNTLISVRSQWRRPFGVDNMVTMSFESVVCEDVVAKASSLVKFIVTVSRFDEEIAAFERHFKRDISSKMANLSLNISVQANGTIKSGQSLNLTISLNHSLSSTSLARNVDVTVRLPPFIKYHSLVSSEPNNVTGTVLPEGVVFKIPVVYFVDTFIWVIKLNVDPDKTFPKGMEDKTVTLIADAVYRGRTSIKVTKMAYSKFKFGTEGCNEPLGLEDSSKIKDCQISASMSMDNSAAKFVRLNTPSESLGWQFLNRGPTFEGKEYIQIKIGNEAEVLAVSIQASANDNSNYVKTFKLKHSQEGMFWQDVKDSTTSKPKTFTVTFGSNQSADAIHRIEMGKDRFKARYVRLLPETNSKSSDTFVLRMELHVCMLTSDVSDEDVCDTNTAVTYPTDYYDRGYMVDPNNCYLYVCALPAAGKLPVCSFTTDAGTTWSPIDSVININCMDSATKRLVGLTKNLKLRVLSEDGGETWYAHADADCSKLNQDSLVKAKPLPYENTYKDVIGDDSENWDCPKKNIKVGVTTKGLYTKDTKAQNAKWSSCVASFGTPCD